MNDQALNEILEQNQGHYAQGHADLAEFRRSQLCNYNRKILIPQAIRSYHPAAKRSSASRPNSLSHYQLDTSALVVVSATIAAADIGQHVVRGGQRAIVAMTQGVLEAVCLGGLGSG